MPPSGLPAGTRGLRQPAAVSERRQAAAGLRLHPAGEEGHLHRRQAQVPTAFQRRDSLPRWKTQYSPQQRRSSQRQYRVFGIGFAKYYFQNKKNVE